MTLHTEVSLQFGSPKPTILGLVRNGDEGAVHNRDDVTMGIAHIPEGGAFIGKLVDAAIEKDRRAVYTKKGGLYTGPLKTIIRNKDKDGTALLELASYVVVSYFPTWELHPGVVLHFYLGDDFSPKSVHCFAAARVLTVNEPDH